MTRIDRTDALIAEFLAQRQPDLPDPVFDAVRGEIQRTRQRSGIGGVPGPIGAGRLAIAAAAVVILAVAITSLKLLPGGGPVGGPSTPGTAPSPTAPSPTASSPAVSPTPHDAAPRLFTSPLYGYKVTLPALWSAVPATARWDGHAAVAFGDPDVDAFSGPNLLVVAVVAVPFAGDLPALGNAWIAATTRDHVDSCPAGALQVDEPISVAGQPGTRLGWNCGLLINQALTIRDGIGYAFSFRDPAIKAARDPTDLAIFSSILNAVQLPATPTVPNP